jgi:hypothetical protein
MGLDICELVHARLAEFPRDSRASRSVMILHNCSYSFGIVCSFLIAYGAHSGSGSHFPPVSLDQLDDVAAERAGGAGGRDGLGRLDAEDMDDRLAGCARPFPERFQVFGEALPDPIRAPQS